MAYFSNGTEGMVFDHQCSLCKYGDELCPICLVQINYNYEACNNPVARKILDELIADNGTCAMFKAFKKDFSKKEIEKEAPSLFEEIFPKAKECDHSNVTVFATHARCRDCGCVIFP